MRDRLARIARTRSARHLPLLLSLLVLGLVLPSVAPAIPGPPIPETTLVTDPASPDGPNGWFVTKPAVSASSDLTGTVYYRWSDHRRGSLEASPGASVGVGSGAIEGTSSVTVYTVSSEGVTETSPARLTLRIDTLAPSTPGQLVAWKNAAGWVRLSFSGAVDGGSGVESYRLYRTLGTDEPELIATLPSSATRFDDHDPLVAEEDVVTYSVSAVDRVGHESEPCEPEAVQVDVTPPTVPEYFQVGPVPGDPYDYYWSGGYPDTSRAGFTASVYGGMDTGSGIGVYRLEYGPDKDSLAYSMDVPFPSIHVIAGKGYFRWYFRACVEDRAGNRSVWTSSRESRFVPVDRVAGADRIATALLVSKRLASSDSAVFVSWASPVDGLLAASLAGALDAPIIPVAPGTLPQATLDELDRLGVTKGYVVGGTGAVSAATYGSIDAALSGTLKRVAGADRYGTALLVADAVRDVRGENPTRVYVVSGTNLTNALPVAAAAYAGGDPIIFAGARIVSNDTMKRLFTWRPRSLVILGTRASLFSYAEYYGWAYGVKRISATDAALTSQAFRDWAVLDRVFDDEQPVLLGATDFADGPAAAMLAGSRGSSVILVAPRYSLYRYFSERSRNVTGASLVGGFGAIPEYTGYSVWSALNDDRGYYYW